MSDNDNRCDTTVEVEVRCVKPYGHDLLNPGDAHQGGVVDLSLSEATTVEEMMAEMQEFMAKLKRSDRRTRWFQVALVGLIILYVGLTIGQVIA